MNAECRIERCEKMRFNTHNRTPKKQTPVLIKFLYALIFILVCATPLILVLISGSIFAIFIVFTCVLIGLIMGFDFEKAYVEFNNDEICVVDYCFLVKKEKHFKIQDINTLEIVSGYSLRFRYGKSLKAGACRYIIFKDANNKYLFKIFYTEENYEQLRKYVE